MSKTYVLLLFFYPNTVVIMSKDTVSIEKVLNSRCSCGFENGLKKRHWGVFVNTTFPRSRVDDLLLYCRIPQFSGGKLSQWFVDERLFVGFVRSLCCDGPWGVHIQSRH
jgi:hypothetical protein